MTGDPPRAGRPSSFHPSPPVTESKRPIAVVLCGRTEPSVRARRGGDFDAWFASGLGANGRPAAVRVIAADEGERLDGPDAYAGAVFSGSPAMVTQREPWSLELEAWCRAAHGRLPLLGVCYGHQLLTQALGGEVADNPRGIEVGYRRLEHTADAKDDPLLFGLPDPLGVFESHTQSVVRAPDGATVLLHNDHDPHQALRLGHHTWSVQFHPEFDADITRGYLEARRALYTRKGLDVDALLAGLVDDDASRALLTRFAARCQGSAAG